MASIERNPVEKHDDNAEFADTIGKRIAKFGIVPLDAPSVGEQKIRELRRSRRRRGEEERAGFMTLVDVDGVLHWELGTGPAPSRLGRRRRARSGDYQIFQAKPVRQFKFEDLPPNEVGRKLMELDNSLTPKLGLRAVAPSDGAIGRIEKPVKEGRILLFVHGTFSNCDHLIHELRTTAEGQKLFKRLVHRDAYTQVLAFNHPTLSMSPILNAAALARSFRGSRADVDVICHSRGGLVTRWWREFLDHTPNRSGRVVFAGSPLAGTGLAAPARLKASLDLLTNISETLRVVSRIGGAVIPGALAIGEAAAVLFGWFGKITALAARTPIIDAGVQLIPGLAAQSREGANGELLGLRESFRTLAAPARNHLVENYYFLTCNFETDDPGWKFWRYFRRDKCLDIVTNVVFEGANDLVVDTQSMTDLADTFGESSIPRTHVVSLGSNGSRVHHLNYFQQQETFGLIRKAFRLADN